MSLTTAHLHPEVRQRIGDLSRLADTELPLAERLHVDTLLALDRSQRSEDEMNEAASVLIPLLDARLKLSAAGPSPALERLDQLARTLHDAAQAAASARSGMAVEFALDRLRLTFDEVRSALAR